MPERIIFYFDQHVQAAVARGLRRRDVQVLTAQEADRCGYSDLEQLEFAQANDYVLVTFDSDFLVLAAQSVQHAGIVFCKATKYSIGELIHALLLVHDVLNPDEMRNHVEFL
jgi:predicted nuclease of predicted toxin-antitoxin system